MKREMARLLVLLPGVVSLLGEGTRAMATCTQEYDSSPVTMNCVNGNQFSWSPCYGGLGVKSYNNTGFWGEVVTACNSCSSGDNSCFDNAMIQGSVYWQCGSCP